jgi:NAD(P)H-hydrate epimerase
VTVFTPENIYEPVASQLRSAMVKLWQPGMKLAEVAGAVLVGPGLAATDLPLELRQIVRHGWRDLACPLVVDASALDFLFNEFFPKKFIRVLTPHPGEAARMLRCTVPQVQADRVKALREISKKMGGCWVVLKGHQTLVGRAEGEIFVNPSGNPHLAQGGSGDLLAGFIAGLLAQPALQADAGRTLRYAVWQHGAAADQLQAGRGNWTIEDLADEIGNGR